MEKTKTPSKSTIIIRTIFTTLFGIAAIFVPAGTLKWTEAWLFILQPSQPLPSILNLSNTRISVLPEVAEFLVVLFSSVFSSLL